MFTKHEFIRYTLKCRKIIRVITSIEKYSDKVCSVIKNSTFGKWTCSILRRIRPKTASFVPTLTQPIKLFTNFRDYLGQKKIKCFSSVLSPNKTILRLTRLLYIIYTAVLVLKDFFFWVCICLYGYSTLKLVYIWYFSLFNVS